MTKWKLAESWIGVEDDTAGRAVGAAWAVVVAAAAAAAAWASSSAPALLQAAVVVAASVASPQAAVRTCSDT